MKRKPSFFKYFKKGFTLIEIIVVLALMVIGASIAIPNLRGTMTRAQKKKNETYLITAKTTVQSYVDLLNIGDTLYPLTASNGVDVSNYDIKRSDNLSKVLNSMNYESAYGYYVCDKSNTTNFDYQPTLSQNPAAAAANHEYNTYKNKNMIAVAITKNSSGVYKFKALYLYDRASNSIKMTYLIESDAIYEGFVSCS